MTDPCPTCDGTRRVLASDDPDTYDPCPDCVPVPVDPDTPMAAKAPPWSEFHDPDADRDDVSVPVDPPTADHPDEWCECGHSWDQEHKRPCPYYAVPVDPPTKCTCEHMGNGVVSGGVADGALVDPRCPKHGTLVDPPTDQWTVRHTNWASYVEHPDGTCLHLWRQVGETGRSVVERVAAALNGRLVGGQATPAPTTWPEPHQFIVDLREAVGLFARDMPIPPKVAWEEAVAVARRAVRERDEYEAATPAPEPTAEQVRDWLEANVQMEHWGNARLWDIDQVLDARAALTGEADRG